MAEDSGGPVHSHQELPHLTHYERREKKAGLGDTLLPTGRAVIMSGEFWSRYLRSKLFDSHSLLVEDIRPSVRQRVVHGVYRRRVILVCWDVLADA